MQTYIVMEEGMCEILASFFILANRAKPTVLTQTLVTRWVQRMPLKS
jgi:hypothetical protein